MASAQNVVESLFGAIHEDVQYKLNIANVDESLLRVSSFDATETISELFAYTIAVASEPDAVSKFEEALGRDATFRIERDGKPIRIVHGIIADVIPDGAFVSKSQVRTMFVLEPRLANLRYSGGFRIFQNMAAHDIVAELFQPQQIECLWHVHGAPPKREYCTQLDETDLEFVVRITSEEGMHFYFDHDEQKTTVVFVNKPRGYEEIEPDLAVTFNETEGAVGEEHVRSIQRAQRVRVGAFECRDYDFTQPGKALLARAETSGNETTANSHMREVRGYPGRFTDTQVGKTLAQRRLDELRSDASVFTGSASSLRFSVGRIFTLEGHKDDGFNRKLLLTHVSFHGTIQGAHRDGGFRGSTGLVTFTAVPAELTIHPSRRKRPPSRMQTARVVGPKDGTPYVDEHGRVKVQFFWDRDGAFNEHSSCWMRMMTPVAHADEGFWQAHKVGSEVIVGFIDNDIDRPMILGAVYNAAQSQPHPLPAQVAKSTWKTRSIPGNGGFNEITQDNTAGKEVLFMHAQKDRSTVVLANHTETVGASQTSTIGANRTSTVGANRTSTIGANETITVAGHRTETVDTGEGVTIKGGRKHEIATGDDNLVVWAGNRDVNVNLQDSLAAKSKIDTVQTTFDLKAGTSIRLHREGDAELKLEAGVAQINTQTKVVLWTPSGNVTLAENKITLDAAAEVVLRVGGTSISIKDGLIEVKAGNIKLTGGKEVLASVGGSSLKLEPAKATLKAPMTDVNP